ncbi:hypothetical protein KEM54_005095, partial [Ascosphaera aggregata]
MGPKKGGCPKGGAKKHRQQQLPPPQEIDIQTFVASGGSKPKGGTKSAASTTKQTAGKKGSSGIQAEEARKPTIKSIIGGASWTGKLPVNMLSEHCQKQKWEKPEYTMSKSGTGFISSVILRQKNAKTNEIISLPPMHPPPSHKHLAIQPTALEARHFAAAYCLFRVCNMRNIHMMMPLTYRDLWKGDFSKMKTEDVEQGKGWMYEADPFVALEERKKATEEQAKRRAVREGQKMKEKATSVQLGLPAAAIEQGKRDDKSWQRAVKVDMGSKIRQTVEGLIRGNAVWNPYGVTISQAEKDKIVDDLCVLGFRRSHIEEAVAYCKDREEVLEWLLIHIPEDDLPAWSLPENYSAGVSVASGNLVREGKIKRLAAAGYSFDFCAGILDSKGGDEDLAAETLQRMLVQSDTDNATGDSLDCPVWEEEHDTLEAIFAERYKKLSSRSCRVTLEVECLPSQPIAVFRKPSVAVYPESPVILSIIGKDIPAYIRLSATRQAIQHACQDFLGEPMIFNLVCWLEENLPLLYKNPGKLRPISTEAISHSEKPDAAFTHTKQRSRKAANSPDWSVNSPQSLKILSEWEQKQSTAAQQKMLSVRQSLPAWAMQGTIIEAVNSHQVTIISGETGSGKSTQSVQFILDDMIRRGLGAAANIICTQPRRISALSLADRVSDERCDTVGGETGYTVRGDSKVRRGTTKITFMTTGVLLRRMQTGGENIVDSLADVTHVVVDEVHERSLDTDFLLALLREVLKKRRDVKLILMSATLDAHIFSEYFGGGKIVGQISIPGRTFPIEDRYVDDVVRLTGFDPARKSSLYADEYEMGSGLPTATSIGNVLQRLGMGINYDLITATVRLFDTQFSGQPGSVLIFLPGTAEIDRCLAALSALPFAYPLPLHASLTPEEQRRVFFRPPSGKRKVIAATNVAETSITIEDVVAVIDTGRVKETRYDPNDNITRLGEVWASKAACKQRRGRAGRVRSGICYKLYTRKAESEMSDRPEPEIRRVPLEQLCLSVKAMRGVKDVSTFLASTITPPEMVAVDGALNLLHRIGALDNQRLTSLGKYLSIIPSDLRCAKLLIYGAIFGCMEACLTIAAILTAKSPFLSPRDKREEARASRASFSTGDGDLLIDLIAYQQWIEHVSSKGIWKTQAWCSEKFLSFGTLREISSNRAQLLSSLKDVGILPIQYTQSSRRWNQHNANTMLLRALIAGSFNPQVASIGLPDKKFMSSVSGTIEVDPEARTIKYFNQENGRVFVHPSSHLFDAQNFSGGAAFVSYFTKIATSKVFIRDLTPFNAYSLLLFCGPITLDTLGRGAIVDGWFRIRGWARIGVL